VFTAVHGRLRFCCARSSLIFSIAYEFLGETLRGRAARSLWYHGSAMDKDDLASRLARKTRSSKAAAADEVDRVVHQILAQLRRGERARLPGLGTFLPGQLPKFEFDTKKDKAGRER